MIKVAWDRVTRGNVVGAFSASIFLGAACLAFAADDGTIFFPIDSKTTSSSQNPRLMPFAGEHVTVTGKEYVRKSSHALVIEKISR